MSNTSERLYTIVGPAARLRCSRTNAIGANRKRGHAVLSDSPLAWHRDRVIVDADRLKMLRGGFNLGVLTRSSLPVVCGAFGLADHVDPVPAVFMLDDRPVRVVRADGGVDLELVRQLDEEFDVLAAVEQLGKLVLGV
jgi:hypothetical protein